MDDVDVDVEMEMEMVTCGASRHCSAGTETRKAAGKSNKQAEAHREMISLKLINPKVDLSPLRLSSPLATHRQLVSQSVSSERSTICDGRCLFYCCRLSGVA